MTLTDFEFQVALCLSSTLGSPSSRPMTTGMAMKSDCKNMNYFEGWLQHCKNKNYTLKVDYNWEFLISGSTSLWWRRFLDPSLARKSPKNNINGFLQWTCKLILLSLTFCRQDVAKNEDEILPSGQTCVGRAQLCGQICQRKLQIAQGASFIMLPLVIKDLIHT